MSFRKTLSKSGIDVKSASRELVLRAASKVLLRDGSSRFSLRAVARELHCSPGTIYNYYADKDDLIAASTDAAFMRLCERFRAMKKSGTIADRVRRMGEVYVEFGLSNPEDYGIAFTVPASSTSGKIDKPHDLYFLVQHTIAEAVDAGELFGSPDEIVQIMWMGWHGLVSLLIQRPNFPWVSKRRLTTAVLDSIVRSLPTSKQLK